jgi:hypothetical protein
VGRKAVLTGSPGRGSVWPVLWGQLLEEQCAGKGAGRGPRATECLDRPRVHSQPALSHQCHVPKVC